jgi:hypothetical protein
MEDRSLREIVAIPDPLKRALELRGFAEHGCAASLARACHAVARSLDNHARSVALRRRSCRSGGDDAGSY